MAEEDGNSKPIAVNRRARFDYEISDEVEAGLILMGSEVKALRKGTVNLADAYAGPKDGGLWLFNLHIGEYTNAPRYARHEATRPRQLLLHKREISRLIGAVRRDGMTLVPIVLYFNRRGIAKLKIGLGKGKRNIDKRETIKNRDWERRKARVLRGDE